MIVTIVMSILVQMTRLLVVLLGSGGTVTGWGLVLFSSFSRLIAWPAYMLSPAPVPKGAWTWVPLFAYHIVCWVGSSIVIPLLETPIAFSETSKTRLIAWWSRSFTSLQRLPHLLINVVICQCYKVRAVLPRNPALLQLNHDQIVKGPCLCPRQVL